MIADLRHDPGAAPWLRMSRGLNHVAQDYATLLAEGWSFATVDLAERDSLQFALTGTTSADMHATKLVDPDELHVHELLQHQRFELAGVGVARTPHNSPSGDHVWVVIIDACNVVTERNHSRSPRKPGIWPDWCVSFARVDRGPQDRRR